MTDTLYPGTPSAASPHPGKDDRGLFEYFTRAITVNYCNFYGRARRKEFWGFHLFATLFGLGVGVVLAYQPQERSLSAGT